MLDVLHDLWRTLQLPVMVLVRNEGDIRLSWNTAESSHAHEITICVQLHERFTKELTASCGALRAKWRQHLFELKGYRSLSCAWNHNFCSAPRVIFKGTYSFMWCSRRKMKATSIWAERLQKPLMCLRSQYLFSCMSDFQRNLQLHVVL